MGMIAAAFDDNIVEIGDKIASLSLLQAKALGDYLREVHGLEDAPIGIAIQQPTQQKVEAPEIKATVDVMLAKVGDATKKIAVVKAIREATGMNLLDAKAIVDKAPFLVKAGILREEAEQLKDKLEKEGATIELK